MKNSNPELAVEIGKRIKHFRNARSMSQESLAERSGLHRTYIGSCERGERNITILNLSILCESFDITLKVFFDEL